MRNGLLLCAVVVVRRVGGLEVCHSLSASTISVVRRVGGLEGQVKVRVSQAAVVRRVGGLRKPRIMQGLSSFYDFAVFDNKIPQREP